MSYIAIGFVPDLNLGQLWQLHADAFGNTRWLCTGVALWTTRAICRSNFSLIVREQP